MKNILRSLLSIFIPILLFSQGVNWYNGDIALFQWENSPFNNQIRDNIIEGFPLTVDEYQLKGKVGNLNKTLSDISGKNYRLVVIIGAQATTPILRYLSKTPLILLSSSQRLDEIHKRFPTITGVYPFASPEIQFNTIHALIMDLKKIGVIYNPIHSGIEVEMFEKGISDTSIKLIKNGISDPKEIGTALHFMRNIDLLWLPSDPIYRDNKAMKTILNYSYKNKIPVFAPSREFVKKGALVTQEPSTISLEILSIITSIIKGKDISEIQPRFLSGSLVINQKAAKLIGIEIPVDIILSAEEIYK